MEKRFMNLIHIIKQAQTNAIKSLKSELIKLKWNIEESISKKIKQSEWSHSVVTELAKYIQTNETEIKLFSDKNLW